MRWTFGIFRGFYLVCLGAVGLLGLSAIDMLAENLSLGKEDPLLGPRVQMSSQWVGRINVPSSMPFLIMAGHADSQGIAGAGTVGEAVALKGQMPMDPSMSDELYWNLLIARAIVQMGRERGLNITFYDPPLRNIVDGNHPSTNWSVGAKHALQGGYALEIHFDSYGQYGFGSGLIPAISRKLNSVDESLAESFGRYPIFFRGGLGAPKRGIRILEIGKLEGKLENGLRDLSSRENVIAEIAMRVVQSLVLGIGEDKTFNQSPGKVDIDHPVSHH